jgi:hypothetical protein
MFNGTLERAVLETLAYSDVFDYPLRLDELHRYLPVRMDVDELWQALGSLKGRVGTQDGYYFLPGRETIMEIRRRREAHSRKLMPHALHYGRLLGALPFIRMVALTGSLAVMNSSGDADFDYMLVAAPGRVWTARAFALLLNRVTRWFGHRLCPNLIVSENALAWSAHDLYSARELCQMVPIAGFDIYQRLMQANKWVKDFLPNASMESGGLPPKFLKLASGFQDFPELLLDSAFGDRFEQWEMTRKIARFSKQPGFGEETVFNAEICQGNFDHHRKWTREAFEMKINNIVIASQSVASGEAIPNAIREIASSPIGSSQ